MTPAHWWQDRRRVCGLPGSVLGTIRDWIISGQIKDG